MGVGLLKFCQRGQGWWCAQDWTSCMIKKRGGSGGGEERGRNVEKLVTKCNKNVNLPYCGEYLSVNTGQCDIAGIVGKGENSTRTRLFKGQRDRAIKYHCVLLWNGVAGDWLSVGMWFGTCCAPGARMRAHGLVHPLFVAQTKWFGKPDVCSAKGEWVEPGVECNEIRDGINVQVCFKIAERTMGHMKLLLSKGSSLMRGEVY